MFDKGLDMKKVGIVSCYYMKNYGSMLQAYATQKILDDFGIENETICIKGLALIIKFRKIKYFITKIFDLDTIKNKWIIVKHYIFLKCNINGFKNNIQKRNDAFDKFLYLFHISEKFQSFKELEKASNKYDAIIVGSDQLWLPSNIEANYYTLNWVPEEINKIAYATSFGVSSLDTRHQKLAKTFLSRISHLSVREQSGQKLIKEIAGIEAQIVCDPTLLFTAEEWMSIQNNDSLIQGQYIFCYFIGNNPEQRDFVKELKNATGYKIVALQHIDEYINSDEGFADLAPYDVTPGEFINLIRNAQYVCTDSFHGSVFSILNKKIFFTFRRFRSDRKVSTNSRLESLFNLLDLNERLFSEDINIEECLRMEIDYDIVHEKLAVLREESKNFLYKALGLKLLSNRMEK